MVIYWKLVRGSDGMKKAWIAGLLLLTLALTGCGYTDSGADRDVPAAGASRFVGD